MLNLALQIYYRESTATMPQQARLDITSCKQAEFTCTYVLSDLTVGKTYYVWLVAVNDAGASAPTEQIQIVYDKGAITEPVTDFKGKAQGPWSIKLTWGAPNNSLVSGYKIVYSDEWNSENIIDLDKQKTSYISKYFSMYYHLVNKHSQINEHCIH